LVQHRRKDSRYSTHRYEIDKIKDSRYRYERDKIKGEMVFRNVYKGK
jgi:hypothetical protein